MAAESTMRLEVGEEVPSTTPLSQPLHLDAFGWAFFFFFFLTVPAWLRYCYSFLIFIPKHLPDQTLCRLSSPSPGRDPTGQKMKANSDRLQRASFSAGGKGEQEPQDCALRTASLILCKAPVLEESGKQILV